MASRKVLKEPLEVLEIVFSKSLEDTYLMANTVNKLAAAYNKMYKDFEQFPTTGQGSIVRSRMGDWFRAGTLQDLAPILDKFPEK